MRAHVHTHLSRYFFYSRLFYLGYLLLGVAITTLTVLQARPLPFVLVEDPTW